MLCVLTAKRGICITDPEDLVWLCNTESLTETNRKKVALIYFENCFKLGDLIIEKFIKEKGEDEHKNEI